MPLTRDLHPHRGGPAAPHRHRHPGRRALGARASPSSWSATYNLADPPEQRGTSWLTRGLLDPLSLPAIFTQGRARTELSDANSQCLQRSSLGYSLQLQPAGIPPPARRHGQGPAQVAYAESEAGKALATRDVQPGALERPLEQRAEPRTRPTTRCFPVPVARPATTVSIRRRCRSPTSGATPAGSPGSRSACCKLERRHRQHPRPAGVSRLDARSAGWPTPSAEFFLGIPVGVERDRTVTTALALTPRLSLLAPAPVHHQQQLPALPDTQQPRPGPGGRGQRRLHPAADPEQRAHPRASARRWTSPAACADLAGDSSGSARRWPASGRWTSAPGSPARSTYDLRGVRPEPRLSCWPGGLDELPEPGGRRRARGVARRATATLRRGADLPLRVHRHALLLADAGPRGFSAWARLRARPRPGSASGRSAASAGATPFPGGPADPGGGGTAVPPAGGDLAAGQPGGPRARAPASRRPSLPTSSSSFRNGLALTLGLRRAHQDTETNGNATLLDQDDIPARSTTRSGCPLRSAAPGSGCAPRSR